MKTAIIYSSKYGCTEKCAKMVAEKLGGKSDLYNLKSHKEIDLYSYDKVVIGGSIYMGKIQKEVSEFSLQNVKALKEKKTGLFICCMREGEEAETELRDSFPQELMEEAVAKDYFGGEFTFKKMSCVDRFIAKKIAKVEKDTSTISEEKMNHFVQSFRNA